MSRESYMDTVVVLSRANERARERIASVAITKNSES